MYATSTAFSGSGVVAAASFVVGAVCLVAFVMRQRSIENPLLDLRPFADKGFVCGVVVVFIAFMAVFAMNLLLPLFMQNNSGFSALDAALTLLVPCMSCVVFAPVAGKLFDRYGFKYSLPAVLLAMAVFLFAMSRIGGSATALLLAAVYLPILVGCNFGIGPSQSFALDRLSSELHPHGVTVCYTAIQVAGCIGSSFYVGIMSGVQRQALAAGGTAQQAVAAGFSTSCTVASAFALVGLCFAVATVRFGTRKPEGPGRIRPVKSFRRCFPTYMLLRLRRTPTRRFCLWRNGERAAWWWRIPTERLPASCLTATSFAPLRANRKTSSI